jgi:phosphate:Na+ symporter
MSSTQFTIFNFFSLAGGLALFLYGMQQGEKNIRMIGGANLRKVIATITANRFFSYCAGFATTLITQSSSATTVILVGLVNANIMTLGQSLGMILGSDLGTTITVQLFVFKFYEIAPLLIATGYVASLTRRNERIALYGQLMFALGLIFFGMYQMTAAVTPMRSLPFFETALQESLTNAIIGVAAGAFVTALIHSSAATLTIVIALLESMPDTPRSITALFPVVMGANLGTCVTAFISTFGADISAKRVAWAHFTFKFIGVAILLPLLGYFSSLEYLFPESPALRIALLHTLFNIIIGIIFLPLLYPFETFLEKCIRLRKKTEEKYHCDYLTDSVIGLPVIAIAQAAKEINRMGEKIRNMAEKSFELINNFSHRRRLTIAEYDNEVDFLHEHIIAFLTHIALGELDKKSADYSYQLIMVTTDLEHIGDSISKNVIVLAEKIIQSPLPLSVAGKSELLDFYRHTITDLSETLAAFTIADFDLAATVANRKKSRDELYGQLFNHHLDRLFNRKPESLQTTSIHIDLLEEIRKIDHYAFRIAGHILKLPPDEIRAT